MGGRRTALIIANDQYEHPGLSRLKAPEADAQALANVLGDKQIGGFDVQTVQNEPAYVVQGRIEDLFAESQSDDLVLLHFSGHGLKSDSGELFLAARNTRPDRLASTAVPADFVQRCMRSSRARSIVLFLDCCYGGAFGEGVTVRGSGSANVLESFPAGRLGGGRGRAVITASSAMEYAFEGSNLADEHQQQPSIFTAALVEGLATGEADRDEDGLVSLNELYDYVFDQVRERNPKQTPSRDVELQGELYLARSRRRRLHSSPIPGDVAAALGDENMFTRLGAVAELRTRLTSSDLGTALGAYEALVGVARSDIRYVQDAAVEALASAALSPEPRELRFGTLRQGAGPVTETIRLGGPPIAGAVTVAQSEDWLTVTDDPPVVLVSIDTSRTGQLDGTLTLTGPTGQVVIPVTAEVTGPVTSEVAGGPQPVTDTAPEAFEAPVAPEALEAPVATTAAAGQPEPGAAPAEHEPSRPASTSKPPEEGPPLAALPEVPSIWRASGICSLVSGALMLLCVVLPQQYGSSTWERDEYKAWYLLWLGVVVLVMGTLTVWPPRRVHGLGGVLGAASVSTVIALDMANTLVQITTSELGLGFWVGALAPLVLLAAGILALVAARRHADARFAALGASDWASWAVLVLAGLSALGLAPQALDVYSSQHGWGLQWLLLTLLAVGVPLIAVLLRPVLLGRWMLAGWALACAAPVITIWGFWNHQTGSSYGMWFVLLTLAGLVALAPFIHRGEVEAGHAGPR